jgi:hypothetical protein
MSIVIGLVLGISITIALSLLAVVAVAGRTPTTGAMSEAVDIYERGMVTGARLAERLGPGGAVSTVQRRHLEIGAEVRR